MNTTTFNDLLQWGAVAAILIIAVVTIGRRFIALRKSVKSSDTTCNCGCASCHLSSSCKKTSNHDSGCPPSKDHAK